ncbi:MAG: hypothetical protein M1833_006114 [Piccolia ochrophora]|nr:MAG: hypothetical protein M1833_006114 [Piccolia ochrophora]
MTSRKALNAERLAAKLTASEAAKPPGQRLVERDDFDQHIYSQVWIARANDLANMKQWFMDFVTHPAIQICTKAEDAQRFFSAGGPPFTSRILRMYLEAQAETRVGQVTSQISYRTLISHLYLLISVAKRYQNPIELDVIEAAHNWIIGPLVQRGLVSTVERRKPMIIGNDLTSITQAVFSIAFMATFGDTRIPLLFGLYLGLAVDCCGRVSELLARSMKRTRLTKHQEKKCFRWGHVEIYAFPSTKDAREAVTFKAKLQFDLLKSPFFDPTKTKTIPLRLLPPELASQDSLRLLIILALIDGVFENHTSWSSLEKVRPGPHGTLIKFKDSFQDTPGVPIGCRFMGLQYNLLPGAIRRGNAYLLAMTATPEERMARMGHTPGRLTYWKHYRNKTSTFDYQAHAHGAQEEDLSVMSSIMLDSRADAPASISLAGLKEVYADPTVLDLSEAYTTLANKLIEAHGSLKQASSTDPLAFTRYAEARKQWRAAEERLKIHIFRREYAAFFDRDCPVEVETTSTKHSAVRAFYSTSVDHLIAPEMIDSRDEFRIEEERSDRIDDSLPDLQLATASQTRELQTYLGGCDLEDNKSPAGTLNIATPSETEIDVVDKGSTGSITHRKPQRGCSKRVVAPWTVLDRVPDTLFNQELALSESRLADVLVDCFNHLHIADLYFPGQEPLPGEYTCRFCGQIAGGIMAASHAKA